MKKKRAQMIDKRRRIAKGYFKGHGRKENGMWKF